MHQIALNKLALSGIEVVHRYSRKHSSGIILIKSKSPQEMEGALRQRKILVTGRVDGVRLALQFYNNENDIDGFIKNFLEIEKTF